MLFDRKLLFHNHFRQLPLLKQNAFLYQEVARQMLDNLQIYRQKFSKILIIGDKLGNIKQGLLDLGYTSNNIFSQFDDLLFDEENLSEVKFSHYFTDGFDLIISLLSLHFINNPPSFLQQVKHLLNKEGLFLASFFGEEHLPELFLATQQAENFLYQRVSARMPPLIGLKTATHLLVKAGFASPLSMLDMMKIQYSQLKQLLQDLKIMGCSNILFARPKNFITKNFLQALEKFYPQQLNGTYLASFSVIYLSGRSVS